MYTSRNVDESAMRKDSIRQASQPVMPPSRNARLHMTEPEGDYTSSAAT